MKLLLFSLLLTGTSIAGFKLPSSVFKPDQIAEATAEAVKENKPLVLIVTGHKSN